jgi:hypothetical protein
MSLRSKIIVAGLVGAAALAGPALAQDKSPFAKLDGNWAGTGTITMGDGSSEPIRCRVKYELSGSSGGSLTQSLTCASDSYKFELKADVEYRNGAVTGYWTERTRNTSGKLKGKASDDVIQATVETPGFIAILNVTTKGNQQRVTIKSPSTDIREIQIALKRS